MKLPLLLVALSALLFACNSGDSEGLTSSVPTQDQIIHESGKFDNGQVKQRIYFNADSTMKMKEEAFYQDGSIFSEGGYSENKRSGKWSSFHPNGEKWSEHHYTAGNLDGKYSVWSKSGQLKIEGSYQTGKKIGTWTFYNDEGEVVNTEEY